MERMSGRAERWVTYLRVSTDRQGQSGLGLEAQRAAVENHLAGRGRVVAEVLEVESGRGKDRPDDFVAWRCEWLPRRLGR